MALLAMETDVATNLQQTGQALPLHGNPWMLERADLLPSALGRPDLCGWLSSRPAPRRAAHFRGERSTIRPRRLTRAPRTIHGDRVDQSRKGCTKGESPFALPTRLPCALPAPRPSGTRASSLDLVQQQLRTSGVACLVKRRRWELECLALIEWICGECPRQGQRYAAELGRL
jgi:hypothetical protein